MKTCSKCKTPKPEAEYYRDKYRQDGLCVSCKQCHSDFIAANREKQKAARHLYYLKNTDKIKKAKKEWRLNNIEKDKETDRIYRQKNAETIKAQQKIYQEQNRHTISQRVKKYKEQNLEKVRKQKRDSQTRCKERDKEAFLKRRNVIMKRYYDKHHEKIRNYYSQYRPKYDRLRKKVDVNYRLAIMLRKRLTQAIKGQSKGCSAISDLGCSIEQLKEHLESKFQPGMSWDNWTLKGWHIDHIIPLSAFDLTKEEECKKACHFTNLQPLWAVDNIKKSNKII